VKDIIAGGESEWDEPPRREIPKERFTTLTADIDYCRKTNYRVTAETFAREERRKNLNVDGDRGDLPPPGLVCSARLGQVSTLL
jgi:hypothetical protein